MTMEAKLIPYSVSSLTSEAVQIPDGIAMIRAHQYWDNGYTGTGQVIAVLDTGVDASHPALAGRIVGGQNFSSSYNGDPWNYADDEGHGTHVAGTIAACREISGVAPDAQLLIVKVLNSEGKGNYLDIISGINYAINWRSPSGNRVTAMCMSLGGPNDYILLHDAVKRAVNAGIMIVCAAGNDGDGDAATDEYAYPGRYPEVVSVGATTAIAEIPSFSNSHDEIDLVAPGSAILSSVPGGGYAKLWGTSMAAPHVAGAVALIAQRYQSVFGQVVSEPTLFELLINHTGDLGYDKKLQGHGILNLLIKYDTWLDPNHMTLDQALDILTEAGKIDSPQLWSDVCTAAEQGQFHEGLRFLHLLLKKWAVDVARSH